MDLRRFRHLEVLAGSGSLHRAARKLGLSQPALSQSIRTLEADVGIPLVERSPSGTHLTRAGDVFLQEIRLVLTALNRAVQNAKLATDTAGLLRLGITPDVITSRFLKIIRGIDEIPKNYDAVISDGSADQLISLLDKGLLDLAFLPIDTIPEHLGSMEMLWREDLYLALPTSHPLATESIIDLRRLAEQPIITKAGHEPDPIDQLLLKGCHAVGATPRVVAAMQFREARLALVAIGFGLTALPINEMWRERDNIVYRPTIPPLTMSVAAAWPTSGQSTEAQEFLKKLRSAITAENHQPSAHHAASE